MPKSMSIPLDAMRAYRACLNCRNRKSKCDLNLNQGRPPCRRCQRENKECILGESHRGGRRVRKKPKLEDGVRLFSPNLSDIAGNCSLNTCLSPHHSPLTLQPEVLHSSRRNWPGKSQSCNQIPLSSIQLESKVFKRTQYSDVGVQKKLEINSPESRKLTIGQQSCNGKKCIVNSKLPSLQEGIAAANLQNPADALEILHWAANQKTKTSLYEKIQGTLTEDSISLYDEPRFRANDRFHYEPVQKEMISIEAVYSLFERYAVNFKGKKIC
ncbi:BgTH12-04298 [Blumeria graminis f. sp. triticale]|uniref:BgTH12-04298 n=1 Tax=Blumeria graminis f. sp. triticale TaxID=1689686 RepID=A0A9W4GDU6_BLUGR|nr:BgTH12-04298 [Blumeria graminis f. sp. triticale]